MPCFKGLAVSIHTPKGPLPEYSIQRQVRHSRITSYIPVPPAEVRPDTLTNKPEQSTFAISITLLTPGLRVPYSPSPPGSPGSSPDSFVVGPLPTPGVKKEKDNRPVAPYAPTTTSVHETVAAYIYFDGRAKEEVATLLRRGEETWVNSRWVSVPASEGGGLAEREFLFREVGLEKWLNGLDLKDEDTTAKIERRKRRLEKKRQKEKEAEAKASVAAEMDMDPKEGGGVALDAPAAPASKEDPSDGDETSDSEPDMASSEAAGQIKITLFRVIASGDIKRGEYSPQFDAHDDDEESSAQAGPEKSVNGGVKSLAEVDHTTSFAQPKTLDPRTISTQTVSGIDPPDKPYAVFTFLYRSDRQLQKMKILPVPNQDDLASPPPNKRSSVGTDFTNLPALKPEGTVGFAGFRDRHTNSSSVGGHGGKGKGRGRDNDDSDDDDDADVEEGSMVDKLHAAEDDRKDGGVAVLSAEDAARQRELAEGVRKIKLKRAHSVERLEDAAPRKAPASSNPGTATHTPSMPSAADRGATPPTSHPSLLHQFSVPSQPAPAEEMLSSVGTVPDDGAGDDVIGSPMKRSRPSLASGEDNAVRRRLGLGLVGTGTDTPTAMSVAGPALGEDAFPNLPLFGAITAATTTTTTTTSTTMGDHLAASDGGHGASTSTGGGGSSMADRHHAEFGLQPGMETQPVPQQQQQQQQAEIATSAR
ncbi:MAG: hypothetical protein M1826_002873 [Phylliscum demangeonii]|nr:MAG: hypothetical protein M1826_002873 [Phylliscum demangeonii]